MAVYVVSSRVLALGEDVVDASELAMMVDANVNNAIEHLILSGCVYRKVRWC